MRMPIVEYVAELGLDRVSPRRKAMLAVIASYYNTRYRSANVDISTIANELLVADTRWLRRQIEAVDKKILEHTAGRGPGAFYSFKFPEFEAQAGAEKRVNGGSKEGDKRVPSGCPEGDDSHPNKEKTYSEDLLQNPSSLAAALQEFEIKDFHRALANERGLDASAVFLKFRDFCLANGKHYEDLDAALSWWLRNERVPHASTSPKQSNAQLAEQAKAEARRILDEEIARGQKKLPRASGE